MSSPLPPPPPPPSALAPPVPAWEIRRPARPRCPIGAILLIAGAAVITLGALLPWFELAGESFNGFSDIGGEVKDGPAFVLFAIILAGFGVTTLVARRLLPIAILAVVIASFSTLAAIVDWSDVRDAVDFVGASTGPGLPVALVGSLIALAGGIVALATRRR